MRILAFFHISWRFFFKRKENFGNFATDMIKFIFEECQIGTYSNGNDNAENINLFSVEIKNHNNFSFI